MCCTTLYVKIKSFEQKETFKLKMNTMQEPYSAANQPPTSFVKNNGNGNLP